MAVDSWQARSPLATAHAVGTAKDIGAPGTVTLLEMPARHAVLILAHQGKAHEVRRRAAESLGFPLPSAPSRTQGAAAEAIWSGPSQWLVMSEAPDAAARLEMLVNAVKGYASASEQTDARIILRLAGGGARRTLMKLVTIDMHEAAFPAGTVAMTPVAHIAAHLWRRPDAEGAPVYEIAAPRSSIGSLWHAVIAAGSELGLEARPLQPAAAK